MRRTNYQLANVVQLYKVELDRDKAMQAEEIRDSSLAPAVKQ